jgi:hypothetical protein
VSFSFVVLQQYILSFILTKSTLSDESEGEYLVWYFTVNLKRISDAKRAVTILFLLFFNYF